VMEKLFCTVRRQMQLGDNLKVTKDI